MNLAAILALKPCDGTRPFVEGDARTPLARATKEGPVLVRLAVVVVTAVVVLGSVVVRPAVGMTSL